jgi:pimeloyl-ACP methyl ester carboxylesterase
MSGTHLAWGEPFLAQLDRDFDVVTYDHRGIGRSAVTQRPFSIADLADDAAGLLGELGWDSAHVVGISMGGMVAQELVLRHPERVRTLTLAVTFAAGGAYARRLAEVWAARVRQVSYEQHVDELMLLNHSESFYDNPDMVEFIRTAMLNNPHPQPPEAFARQIAASSRHDARDRLGSLTMPVHAIGGEYDLLVPVWKAKEVASLIPGAKLTILEGAPHGLSIERAEEFNAAVLEFIREAAATPAA